MNLFGKKKAPAPQMNDTIMLLRDTLNQLDKRAVHLQRQSDENLESAKAKSKKKDKKGALLDLKRKGAIDKQIEGLSGKRLNIEAQIMTMESASTNAEVIRAMQQGKVVIDQNLKQIGADDIPEIMDGIDESMSMANELDAALSQPMGTFAQDEDDLEAQLAELEEEQLAEDMLATPQVPHTIKMPSVPTTKVQQAPAAVSQQTAEDADLAALEAEFA